MIGGIAIISCCTSLVLLIFSVFYEIKYVQIGVFTLMMLYSDMKIKYRELRNLSQNDICCQLSLIGITLYKSDIYNIEYCKRTVK